MPAKILLLLLFGLPVFLFSQPAKRTGEFYQVTVYHYSSAEQQTIIEQYLQDAYIPALHRQHINKVGIFTALANDTVTDKRLYLIIPVSSLQQVADLSEKFSKDNEYLTKGKAYLDAVYDNAPYNRLDVILLKAFPYAPFMNLPKLSSAVNEKIYELRSYESATENIFKNKVKMFNEGGEVELFKKLNFNAVFYGSVIAGSRMPNLMYMTSFENMKDRDEHWKSFSSSPEWKTLSALPEYQHNVSKSEITFLRAATYSDY